MGRSLLDKVWDLHKVGTLPSGQDQIFIGLHLIHEVTSPQAFQALSDRGLSVMYPERTFATVDHIVPTDDQRRPFADTLAEAMMQAIERNTKAHGIQFFGLSTEHQGIVHIIGPELGLTQPGMTIVCGDSHTATHGAFGALAFGIGTSEIEMVLATQTLLQRKPKTFRVQIDGRLQPGVGAKDIILALIARIGIGGGTGHVIEYTGDAIRALSMEERMTVCNMSIEGGARAGMIAPDDITVEYIAGREFAPAGAAWDKAVTAWRELRSDSGAAHDRSVTLDARTLKPMITYGTNPGMAMAIDGRVPDPQGISDQNERATLEHALHYMGVQPGQRLIGTPVDVVFIGSCTNSRISDLREAAGLLRGRKVKEGVRMLVVPGSREVKRIAESEGLDHVFREAGAEWREAGCSMCIAMNGDQLAPGQLAVSTSNRNFEGRQGPGSRTMLASPLTAVAAAITGTITDVRTLLPN